MEYTAKTLRLGNAGMRGVVGSGLDLESASDFAGAFGTIACGGRVLLGRDTRASSQMLTLAAAAALAACGCEVLDGGILTAGMMHGLIAQLHLAGGILVSGGHQPAGWNSLIPFNDKGEYFNRLELRELFDLYHSKNFSFAKTDELQKIVPFEASSDYFQLLTASVDADAIRQKNFKVLGDFCNGAGSCYARRFADCFNLRLIAVNCDPDGDIPHDPEVRPGNGSPIASVIRELNGDLGLVFNSDTSRLGLVAENGDALTEEWTFPLAADYLLASHPAKIKRVITNICSSRTIDDVAAKHGYTVEKVPVGQSNILDAMRCSGAILGGEGSGGFALDGAIRGFDGFLMSAWILEAMAKTGMTLSALAARLPVYHIVKMSVESPELHGYSKLRKLKGLFPASQVSELDGIRFDFPDGWVSLRISGTEKIVRLISESTSNSVALERAWQLRTLLENA